MSKKIMYNKRLLKGKFYAVTGHPGLIIKKNDKKNRYLAVVTGTTRGRHMTKLKVPTEPNVDKSYVKNRPVLGKRKHFGSKELVGMRIHKKDKALIKSIGKRNPTILK